MIFAEFFIKFLRPFKVFGLTEFHLNPKLKKLFIKKYEILILNIGLLIYLVGLFLSFSLNNSNNRTDKISKISNLIQIITNSVALVVAIFWPFFKLRNFNNLIEIFNKIDTEINILNNTYINYEDDIKKCLIYFLIFILYILFIEIYDFFVVIIQFQLVPLWYWFVTNIPLIIYSFLLLQAFLLIFLLRKRCRIVNKIIKNSYIKEVTVNSDNKNFSKVFLLINEDYNTDLAQYNTSNLTQRNIYAKIFTILNHVCDLTNVVEHIYGLIFLTTFSALFAVTSIQMFYCYLVVTTEYSSSSFSTLSLITSLNIILLNLILIIGIATVCEKVSNETKHTIQSLSKIQVKIERDHVGENFLWIHPLISNLKFTAFGFFAIDYNMLCGFFAALITYLVIFIQFNSVLPTTGGSDPHYTRTN